MHFTIYSKDNCPYCYKAKTVIELCGHNLDIVTLDQDFSKEEFYQKFGNGSTFPQIILDETHHIGGCTDVIQYLKDLEVKGIA